MSSPKLQTTNIFLYLKKKITYFFERPNNTEKGGDKEKDYIYQLTRQPGPGWLETRNQELHLRCPHDWQEFKHICHCILPSQVHWQDLHGKCCRQYLNQHSNIGWLNTCCHQSLFFPSPIPLTIILD